MSRSRSAPAKPRKGRWRPQLPTPSPMPPAAACATCRSAPSASRRYSVRVETVFVVRLARRGYSAPANRGGANEDRGWLSVRPGALFGRYRTAFVGVCHCKDCQKASGTAFRVVFAVPKPALTVQGPLKTFNGRGDSGKTLQRRFCPECGSAITADVE